MNKAIRLPAAIAALLLGAPALAQAPALIPVQGFLTDDQGEPRDGELVFDLRLFPTSVDGEAVHEES